MSRSPSMALLRVMGLLAGLLIVKVTVVVVIGYRDYFPADFGSDFLLGREAYFFGAYRWAFYAHILAGPITLLLGLLLLNEWFRLRSTAWHRTLGKVQVAVVLGVLCPSGLWMARYAMTGVIAGWGFALLAVATATCVWFGWRRAVQRRFDEHRRWMWRCFLLLSSAVVLRLIGGLASVSGIGETWSYPLAAWVSWLGPLAVYELSRVIVLRRTRRLASRDGHSQSSNTFWSLPAMEMSARR
ncbi:MAG: DUF2306 domain-containing protein [Pirellulales bacterium]|nr:DUF2306 domain-containing protein [Pirellulales bacterium]